MLILHDLATSMLLASEYDDHRHPLASSGKFPYPITRTYLFGAGGTPVVKRKKIICPFPDDFPPSTTVWLEDAREYPSISKSGGVYMIPARNVLRVYNVLE